MQVTSETEISGTYWNLKFQVLVKFVYAFLLFFILKLFVIYLYKQIVQFLTEYNPKIFETINTVEINY